MEEVDSRPTLIHSVHMIDVQETNIFKKRKFQAEQLGLPEPKHTCWDRCLNQEQNDESEHNSDKGSNSFLSGDPDSNMSPSDESKTDTGCLKIFLTDQPSTSSANWIDENFKTNLYSLDSRSASKSSSDKEKMPFICDYEEHCTSSDKEKTPFICDYEEHCNENIEQYSDNELEHLLYSNEVDPNSYILSSGRWDVNKETQSVTKKLTIDKEFEQYFSTLLL